MRNNFCFTSFSKFGLEIGLWQKTNKNNSLYFTKIGENIVDPSPLGPPLGGSSNHNPVIFWDTTPTYLRILLSKKIIIIIIIKIGKMKAVDPLKTLQDVYKKFKTELNNFNYLIKQNSSTFHLSATTVMYNDDYIFIYQMQNLFSKFSEKMQKTGQTLINKPHCKQKDPNNQGRKWDRQPASHLWPPTSTIAGNNIILFID